MALDLAVLLIVRTLTHALKNALRIGRQGEIRDRTSEGLHFRMVGLNFLAAIIIYWNTSRLSDGRIYRSMANTGGRKGLSVGFCPLRHQTPDLTNQRERIAVLVDGAIETPSVKNAITEIMEGGKDAFELRGRKYQFI